MNQKQKLERVIAGWRRGESNAEIAAATGYSEGGIPSIVSKLRSDGVKLVRRKGGRPKLDRKRLGK